MEFLCERLFLLIAIQQLLFCSIETFFKMLHKIYFQEEKLRYQGLDFETIVSPYDSAFFVYCFSCHWHCVVIFPSWNYNLKIFSLTLGVKLPLSLRRWRQSGLAGVPSVPQPAPAALGDLRVLPDQAHSADSQVPVAPAAAESPHHSGLGRTQTPRGYVGVLTSLYHRGGHCQHPLSAAGGFEGVSGRRVKDFQ